MEIARLYRDAQASFVDLARTLSADDWATPSPCTPGWTVRDVLSHAAGVTLDIVEGNVEGAATDPWTAAQVDRWRDAPVDELLARWDATIEAAAAGIEAVGEARPPFDCHTHEHDIRCALARPGNRDAELVVLGSGLFGSGDLGRAVRIELVDGDVIECVGTGEPLVVSGVTRFELFRSRLGRRSADQVRAWHWNEPVPDDVLASFFMFGPAATDIIE
jgi:uncharacterized protein (TIGR03083 family)